MSALLSIPVLLLQAMPPMYLHYLALGLLQMALQLDNAIMDRETRLLILPFHPLHMAPHRECDKCVPINARTTIEVHR